MKQSIAMTFPVEMRQALEDLARKEGRTADDIIQEAVRQHLFLRRFRSLRERLSAQARSRGVATDQDVFDRSS